MERNSQVDSQVPVSAQDAGRCGPETPNSLKSQGSRRAELLPNHVPKLNVAGERRVFQIMLDTIRYPPASHKASQGRLVTENLTSSSGTAVSEARGAAAQRICWYPRRPGAVTVKSSRRW